MKADVVNFSLGVISFLLLVSCGEKKRELNFPETNLETTAFIPKPLQVTATKDGFALDQFTAISTAKNNSEFEAVASFLAEKIKGKTNLNIPVNSTIENKGGTIYFKHSTDENLNTKEAYRLAISKDSVILSANTSEGAFRGVQTFRQLIPEKANDTLAAYPIWTLPTGTIVDRPIYEYRGAMLDVARHFFSVQDVKKYIDLLAYYKYNVLHLHLSDDQGWRIEIKSWPKLTEIGGSTEVGGGPGGFYTQDDYKEIVSYAAKYYMTIVPEIDMPGHTNAASVSYPILNGNGKTPKLYTGMRVGFSTLDTRKDTVYQFIDDVVREISAITPGPYFHMGGDESDVTKKEDYLYFIKRVEEIVQKHNKRLIGWDEVGQVDLSATSISQFWRHADFVKQAIDKKMKVIMSPANKAYLDMKYDSLSKHGLKWAGFIPVDAGYQWHPEDYEDIPKESILGIEAPLWSETITNSSELEYLAFPRAIGYAELGWTPKENRNWEDYKIRLANQSAYLERMKVNYYNSPLIDWKKNDFGIEKLKDL